MEPQDQVLGISRLKKINFNFLFFTKLLIFFILFSFCSSNLLSKEIKIIASEENIEQLLKIDQNNIDFLNIYALKLQKQGKYKESITIYKKIITINPNLYVFYLELAKAQFLIQDFENSKKNFLYIYNKDIPKNVKYNIRNYLKLLDTNRSQKIDYNFKVAYNDNINNGTYADTVELYGVPFEIDENAKAKGSYEFLTNVNGNKNFLIGSQKINSGFIISHSNFSNSTYDRLKYGFNIGPEFNLKKNNQLNLIYSVSKEEIDDKDLLINNSISLKNIKNINPKFQLDYELGQDNLKFYNNKDYNSDGKFIKLNHNYIYKTLKLGLSLKYTDSDANHEAYGSEKKYSSISVTKYLPRGFLADISLGSEKVDYDAYQSIFSKTRRDKLEFFNLILKNERIYFGSFYPQLNFIHRNNKSNVNVYSTESNSVSLQVVKGF